MDVVRNPMPIGTMPVKPVLPVQAQIPELPILIMDTIDVNSLPEMERFTVELKKDVYGLGITIAGYVCEKGDARRPISRIDVFILTMYRFRGTVGYFCKKYKRR